MELFQWLEKTCGRNRQPAVSVPEGDGGPRVRRRYRFSGMVQGVGFRYEAKLTASQLGLTGWVRNEGDGSVSAEIQGGERAADEFLRAMRAVPRFDIAEVQAEDLPLSGGETGFRVLY